MLQRVGRSHLLLSRYQHHATLLILGLVRVVNRSLEMQAISKTPSQGCNFTVAPHVSSKRKKFDRAVPFTYLAWKMSGLIDVQCLQFPFTLRTSESDSSL